MPTNFDLAEAAINFTAGTEATWNAFVLPIPENVVVYTVDTKKFKKGDGNHRFSELEDGPSIAGIASGEETVVNVLTQLEAGDEDSIISINNEIYDASSTKLTDLVARLNALANSNTVQTANMDAADLQFGLVNSNITTSDNGKLAVVIGHDMSAGVLPNTLSVQAPVNPINIRSIKFYSDSNLKKEVTRLYSNNTYYCEARVQHDTADIDNITISISESKSYIAIELVTRGIFKVTITQAPVDETASFEVTATYNADTVSIVKSIPIIKEYTILIGVYNGNKEDLFYSVNIDSVGNIICTGCSSSEGLGGLEAIIVKFDSSFNILAKKRYGLTNDEQFYTVVFDSSGNIYVCGYTGSEGQGSYDGLIVKFDSSLNILARKRYGGIEYESFFGVAIDSNNNVICVGSTVSEGTGSYNALIVKFDSSLNIVARKRYGGTDADNFRNVITDSLNNIICVGETFSEGAGSCDALIVKFDNNLNIISRKIYGGASGDYFANAVVDSTNNIICVGKTYSEGAVLKALIVKFDASLNILARKYVNSLPCMFGCADIDSSGNIICVGGYNSNAFIVKLDPSLNLLSSKSIGGSSEDNFFGVKVDSNDDIICVGYTNIEASNKSMMVVKIPSDIPSGSFVGSTLTRLILSDMNISLLDSTLTLSNSNLTVADSLLTLNNSTLTLADSNLEFILDKIY